MIFTKRYIVVICLFFILSSFFINPNLLYAQSVSLSANKTSYALSDSILITASVQTKGQQINTAEGQVNFSGNSLTVSDVRYGNSIISLWVVKPTADNSLGIINFTGGIPGGFSGSSGTLFTFVIKPKKVGTITMDLKDVHVLLNDGSGGELQGLKMIPLTLNITKTTTTPTPTPTESTPKEESVTLPDKIPPESFVPMVSHNPSIADDSYFVAFSAVDKDSGVARYEVREIPKIISLLTDRFSTQWKEAVSPYVLSFQSWGSRVEVKAIDGAGNSTISKADKPFGTVPTVVFILFLVLASIILTRIFTKRASYMRRK
ncbi:MAG: hypothetical protein NTX96_00925 [Candidatus Zambryskibacteria bacterium]|nr:hypothetical protein [Candidatus Zambryskibacteria bacterium]